MLHHSGSLQPLCSYKVQMKICIENQPPGDTKEWKCVHGHALAAMVSLVIWDRHHCCLANYISSKGEGIQQPSTLVCKSLMAFCNDPLWRSPAVPRGSHCTLGKYLPAEDCSYSRCSLTFTHLCHLLCWGFFGQTNSR